MLILKIRTSWRSLEKRYTEEYVPYMQYFVKEKIPSSTADICLIDLQESKPKHYGHFDICTILQKKKFLF